MIGNIISATGCKLSPHETSLPFVTIENRDASGTGEYYDDFEPELMVIARNEDFLKLDQLVTDAAKTRLTTLNLEEYFVLLVFQGWKPSGGYEMKIERISRSDEAINVYAQFLEPKEDEAKTDEVTSPYHLVQVEKGSQEWNKDIAVNLIVDNNIVFSELHFIP